MKQETKEEQQERLANLVYRTSGEYDELNLYEKFAIDDFFNQDKSSMIAIVLDESLELSKNFRRFVVDVLNGKIKMPRGRKRKLNRDIKIYEEFIELLECRDDFPTQISVAKKLSDKFCISTDDILKIYKNIKPSMEENDRLQADIWREEHENER